MTFELSAIIGEPTRRKLTSASVTMETSNALEAKPIQGRQRPRRTNRRIPTAASAAARVTANPVTCTGSSGWWVMFQVGARRRSPMASTRTRATTSSPSMPAVASAGSGRAQMGGAVTRAV